MGMLALTFIGLTLLAATVALFSVCLAASIQQPKTREDLTQLGQILRRLVNQLIAAIVLVVGLGAMIALVGCGLMLLDRTLSDSPEPARPPALADGGPVRNIPAIGRPSPLEQSFDELIAQLPVPIVDPDADQLATDQTDRSFRRTSN